MVFNRQKLSRCEEDATCVACRAEEMQLYRLLDLGFSNKEILKKRSTYVEKLSTGTQSGIVSDKVVLPVYQADYVCIAGTQGFIFVVGVTKSRLEFFRNWACSAEKHGKFDPRKVAYVIVLEEEVYETLSKDGFMVESLDWLQHAETFAKKEGISFQETFLTETRATSGPEKQYGMLHSVINSLVAMTSNYFVHQDFKVIQMDIDTVFLKTMLEFNDGLLLPLFEYLDKALTRRDVLGMFEKRNDHLGRFNTGLLVYNPTFYTKRFTETLENLLGIKLHSDQELFNMVIRHYRMQQLSKRLLPRALFTVLPFLEEIKSDDELVQAVHRSGIIHASGPKARERLEKVGAWLLEDGRCIL